MRRFIFPLTALGSLAVSVDCLELVKKDVPSTFHLPIQRKSYTESPLLRDRNRKRQDTLQVTLDNQLTLYFANASLGSPRQDFRFHIDTGSSDLWVNAESSDACQQLPQACRRSGVYSANSSDSYSYVNSDFNISYVDGSGAIGDYARDTLHIGSLELSNFQFGIGYESTSLQSILGIGYTANEVQVTRYGDDPYNNLPAAMSANGIIGANAYSLWLNDLDSSTGSILFGGVDTAKYRGPLQTVPVISQGGTYMRFIIALTGVGTNGNQGSITDDVAIPVLLDSGASISYLPMDIVEQIYSAFDLSYSDGIEGARIDCDSTDDQGTVEFTFSDPAATISVDLSELAVFQGYDSYGSRLCTFGIAPLGRDSEASPPVLGDTFLRSAYVVYDLEGNTISLAQTNFNVTDSDVREIVPSTGSNSGGSGGVPNAEPVPNPVTTVDPGYQTQGPSRIDGFGSSSDTVGDAAQVVPAAGKVVAAAGVAAGLGSVMML
ncbi:MAG: hypothetical protein M1831_001999 [Alyxoria varia]|nr:MAG: hypothetical protein M1831_001999 [Alyxoria varia]